MFHLAPSDVDDLTYAEVIAYSRRLDQVIEQANRQEV